MTRRSQQYPPELRERTVRMVVGRDLLGRAQSSARGRGRLRRWCCRARRRVVACLGWTDLVGVASEHLQRQGAETDPLAERGFEGLSQHS